MVTKCFHSKQTLDLHEGTNVCLECGLVLENQIFLDGNVENKNNCYVNTEKTIAKETLHRLNLPEQLSELHADQKNLANLYSIINNSCVVTVKEFCAVTGMEKKKFNKANRTKICQTNIALLLEKYCKLLDLTFKDYTVIKETIESKPFSGHPPLTIVGYYIYSYCKSQKNLKISMKKICQILSISPISLQRFRKHELSCRR